MAETQTRLSDEEIKRFRQRLLAKRHELMDNIEHIRQVAFRQSSQADETGDISSLPLHQADLGTDAFQQSISLDHMERETGLVTEIDAAIERIENKTYGICEQDGRPISKERLDAIPWARNCIECERRLEQQRV